MELVLHLIHGKKERPLTKEEELLLRRKEVEQEIKQVKQAHKNALSQYNMCNDLSAVDSIIYELNALDARLDYLIKKVKLTDEEMRRASLGSEIDRSGFSDSLPHGAYGGGLSCEGTP